MDTGRAVTTERAGSGAPGRVEGEDDAPFMVSEIIKAKTDKMREEVGEMHGQYSKGNARHRDTH